MKEAFLFALLCLIFFQSPAQLKWNLEQCIEYAVANSISVKSRDITTRQTAIDVQQSRLSQYPVASFGSSLGLTTGRSIDRTTNQFTTQTIFYNTFGLQFGADIYNFGAKKATVLSHQFNYEAQLAEAENLKNDLYLNVLGSYLQVLLNKQYIEIGQVQIAQTAAQLSTTRKLVKAGSLPELNTLQMEAQLAQDSASFTTAKGNWQKSLLQLKALLNLDAATDFDITYTNTNDVNTMTLAELNPEVIYAQAVIGLPRQKADSLLINSARQAARAARALMYPSLSISGNLQTSYSNSKNNAQLTGTSVSGYIPIGVVEGSGDKVVAPNLVPSYNFYATPYGTQFINNFGNGISLNVSVPLFNGGAARKAWQKALLNVKSYELQQQENHFILKQSIYKAWVDAGTSLQTFHSSLKSANVAEKAYAFAVKRYNLGLLNSIDLLATQAKVFEANLRRAIAEYDYIFKAELLKLYKNGRY